MLAFRNRFHGHGSLRWVYQRVKQCMVNILSLSTPEPPTQNTTHLGSD